MFLIFPSQEVDIDLKKSNQETLFEAGCLLLIKEELPSLEERSLYTRIRSLQRLKVRHLFMFIYLDENIKMSTLKSNLQQLFFQP